MKICRFCEKVISDQDRICGNCGYNPQTDTMTADFVKKVNKTAGSGKHRLIGPGVKSFVFWGMMIIVFSLVVKYQAKLGDLGWKVKNMLLGNKVNSSTQALEKAKQKKATGLVDVRSHKTTADKTSKNDIKIEGIFHDPQGKSYVVINGQLVSEKESFRGMLIEKINSDSAEIIQGGNRKVLKVNN